MPGMANPLQPYCCEAGAAAIPGPCPWHSKLTKLAEPVFAAAEEEYKKEQIELGTKLRDAASGRDEFYKAVDAHDIWPEDAARDLLKQYAGLENDGHGFKTPTRFLSMLSELTQCRFDSAAHLDACIKWTCFEAEGDEMIVLDSLPFVSVCNHHVIPFIGVAHVGYVPNELMVGLSKIPRVVQHFARRLQVQERLTNQIAEFLDGHLSPRGLIVVLQAEHMCMTIRGVQTPGARTTTSAVRGVFADHTRTAKQEFFTIVNGRLK